jgi:mono/diheme cytochrome c family protein
MKWCALLLLLGACDWSLHRMQRQPRCEAYAGGACWMQAPEGAVSMDAPGPPPALDRALVERGRDRFEVFCAPCHGVLADGDSHVARAMTLRPPPSLISRAAAALPDQRILDVIAGGYGMMPSYGGALGPRDRAAILHFLRVVQAHEGTWRP